MLVGPLEFRPEFHDRTFFASAHSHMMKDTANSVVSFRQLSIHPRFGPELWANPAVSGPLKSAPSISPKVPTHRSPSLWFGPNPPPHPSKAADRFSIEAKPMSLNKMRSMGALSPTLPGLRAMAALVRTTMLPHRVPLSPVSASPSACLRLALISHLMSGNICHPDRPNISVLLRTREVA
jgi:hypothetical protein